MSHKKLSSHCFRCHDFFVFPLEFFLVLFISEPFLANLIDILLAENFLLKDLLKQFFMIFPFYFFMPRFLNNFYEIFEILRTIEKSLLKTHFPFLLV